MKPWTTLATAPGVEGQQLVLQQRDGVFVIRSGGRELMSSARHHSEEEMARLGLQGVRKGAPTVLVGGLGLGYTVRACLDAMNEGAGSVVVAEISPAVVEWNRTVLAELAKRPLEDPRVEVATADVAEVMRKGKGRFDAILLDIDNGPSAMSAQKNQSLYENQGIALVKASLKPYGVAVIWSAGPDAAFLKRLGKAGLEAREERSHARQGSSATHVLFVAKLSGPRQGASRRP